MKDSCVFIGVYIAIYMSPYCRSYILLVRKFRLSEMLEICIFHPPPPPPALLIVFHFTKNEEILNGKHQCLLHYFLVNCFHFISFLNNSENKGFHYQTFFGLYKIYFRKHFSMPFFSNPWPKCTPS